MSSHDISYSRITGLVREFAMIVDLFHFLRIGSTLKRSNVYCKSVTNQNGSHLITIFNAYSSVSDTVVFFFFFNLGGQSYGGIFFFLLKGSPIIFIVS